MPEPGFEPFLHKKKSARVGYRLRLFRSFARKNRPTACFSLASLTPPNPVLLRKTVGSRSPILSHNKITTTSGRNFVLAERVGFEPTMSCPIPLFESGTFNHSVISPWLLTSMIISITSVYRERASNYPHQGTLLCSYSSLFFSSTNAVISVPLSDPKSRIIK
jgi:hypothetical protein